MKIKLTNQAKEDARAFQKKIIESGLFNKPNYTGLNETDRYYYGYLGEWAFAQFLEIKNIPFEWDNKYTGHIDGGDFLIYGKIYDVKTAINPSYLNLMFPEKQLKHWRDFYVGCRLSGEYIEVIGFIDRQTMEETKPKDFGKGIPTISILLNDLIKIEELIE